MIKFERNIGGMANMMGWEISAPGAAKVEMTPDHHGLVNKTKVFIEIPYYILPVQRYMIMPDGQKVGPHEDHFGEVSRKCIKYLNRMIEVVKFQTGKYWVESLSSRDVFINNFDLFDDNNRNVGGQLAVTPCGGGFGFVNKLQEQMSVHQDILDILKTEKVVPRHDLMYLDALNYFSKGRFNESVILINIALEIFLAQYFFDKLKQKGHNDEEVRKKINKIFANKKREGKNGLHKVLTIELSEIENRSLESNSDLWNKFDTARTKRTNAIHSRSRELTEKEARQTMNGVLEVMNWLIGTDKYPHEPDF